MHTTAEIDSSTLIYASLAANGATVVMVAVALLELLLKKKLCSLVC